MGSGRWWRTIPTGTGSSPIIYLLRALPGESDINRDGKVTLGEAVSYLNQKVIWASRSQYGYEQRPVTLPPLKPADPVSGLSLTKLATIRAKEIR